MKNWIRKWLGLPVPEECYPALRTGSSRPGELIPGTHVRNMFEVISAVNGKIVVFNRYVNNPHGPDKNDTEVYLVPDGADLMETVTVAIASARLR